MRNALLVLCSSLAVACASSSDYADLGGVLSGLADGTCQQLGIKTLGAVLVTGGTTTENADGSTTISSSGMSRDVELRLSLGKFGLVGEKAPFGYSSLGITELVDTDGDGFPDSRSLRKPAKSQIGGLGFIHANSATIYSGMEGNPIIRLNDAMLDGASVPIAHIDVYEEERGS